MFRLTILLLALSVALAQYQPQQYGISTTTPPPVVHQPAQVHYVNIGQDLAGDYKFGYDTGKGPQGQSFREEARLPDGTVKGAYGYVDAAGIQKIVRYTAGKDGFVIDSDTPAGQQPAAQQQPAPAPRPQYQAPQPQPQYQAPQPQPQYQVPQPQPRPQLQLQPQPQPQPIRFQHPAQPQQAQPQPAVTIQNFPPVAPAPQPQQYAPQPQPQYRPQPQPQAANLFNPVAQAAPQPTQFQIAPSQVARPVQPAPQPQIVRQPPPTYQTRPLAPQPQPQPQQQNYPGTPLSAFPELPGVRLIQINPKSSQPQQPQQYQAPQINVPNSFGGQQQPTTTEEPSGPVIINAALLNYDIGSRRQ